MHPYSGNMHNWVSVLQLYTVAMILIKYLLTPTLNNGIETQVMTCDQHKSFKFFVYKIATSIDNRKRPREDGVF